MVETVPVLKRLLENALNKYHSRTALVFQGQTMTYEELF